MFHSVWCFDGWVHLLVRIDTLLFYVASLGDVTQVSVGSPVIDTSPMGAPGKGLGKLAHRPVANGSCYILNFCRT